MLSLPSQLLHPFCYPFPKDCVAHSSPPLRPIRSLSGQSFISNRRRWRWNVSAAPEQRRRKQPRHLPVTQTPARTPALVHHRWGGQAARRDTLTACPAGCSVARQRSSRTRSPSPTPKNCIRSCSTDEMSTKKPRLKKIGSREESPPGGWRRRRDCAGSAKRGRSAARGLNGRVPSDVRPLHLRRLS